VFCKAGVAAAAGEAAGDAPGGLARGGSVGAGVLVGIDDGEAMLVESAVGVFAIVGSVVGVSVGAVVERGV